MAADPARADHQSRSVRGGCHRLRGCEAAPARTSYVALRRAIPLAAVPQGVVAAGSAVFDRVLSRPGGKPSRERTSFRARPTGSSIGMIGASRIAVSDQLVGLLITSRFDSFAPSLHRARCRERTEAPAPELTHLHRSARRFDGKRTPAELHSMWPSGAASGGRRHAGSVFPGIHEGARRARGCVGTTAGGRPLRAVLRWRSINAHRSDSPPRLVVVESSPPSRASRRT